jgi:hypothetical protein
MPRVTERILELNNKCTQVLMFLSFAIAASALLSEKNLSFLPAMRLLGVGDIPHTLRYSAVARLLAGKRIMAQLNPLA